MDRRVQGGDKGKMEDQREGGTRRAQGGNGKKRIMIHPPLIHEHQQRGEEGQEETSIVDTGQGGGGGGSYSYTSIQEYLYLKGVYGEYANENNGTHLQRVLLMVGFGRGGRTNLLSFHPEAMTCRMGMLGDALSGP